MCFVPSPTYLSSLEAFTTQKSKLLYKEGISTTGIQQQFTAMEIKTATWPCRDPHATGKIGKSGCYSVDQDPEVSTTIKCIQG